MQYKLYYLQWEAKVLLCVQNETGNDLMRFDMHEEFPMPFNTEHLTLTFITNGTAVLLPPGPRPSSILE